MSADKLLVSFIVSHQNSMISFGDILKERLLDKAKYPEELKQFYKEAGIDYQKRWAFGVQCFQKRINKDREKEGLKPITFMAVRMKLTALYEITDLRWFYAQCLKYSYTKDLQGNRNTFSKCFWGALDTKKFLK